MKINWGTGIAIFYTIFAVSLVLVVIKSFDYDHSLVVDDYYQKDLEYQSHYDKLVNSQALIKDLDIQFIRESAQVRFSFPEQLKGIKGEIRFMRPSDKKIDFATDIKVNSANQQELPAGELAPGLWKLQVDWQVAGKSYYKEQVLVL